uniref:Uncharacterized protein n=1 Tax=Rhizophora mucronata TaxID=61149 RepID=A0A2P2NVN2_RHIMU
MQRKLKNITIWEWSIN